MGAGHSIAVQNFNENLSILVMLGAYAGILHASGPVHSVLTRLGVVALIGRAFSAEEGAVWVSIAVLGIFISAVMALLWRRYRLTPCS